MFPTVLFFHLFLFCHVLLRFVVCYCLKKYLFSKEFQGALPEPRSTAPAPRRTEARVETESFSVSCDGAIVVTPSSIVLSGS